MRRPRNPFRLRASEHIESDETFVRFFSPDILDMLNTDDIWQRPQIIRSAPGGGKTTLLRLFTPSSLSTIYSLRNQEYTKDLFSRLADLDAIDESGPLVVGVFLGCGHSFATLDDLDLDESRKRRLFLSLLNARIILATLRGILELRQKDEISLSSIFLKSNNLIPESPRELEDATGTALFKWAQGIESTICEALDSFRPLSESRLPGIGSLEALKMLGTSSFFFEDGPVAIRFLVMLDDIHYLTKNQRKWLIEEVLSLRIPVSIWLAERFEALTVDQLLSSGSPQGRDFDRVIAIEKYWVQDPKKFEKMMSDLSNRRVFEAKDVEIGRFADCLQDTLDGDEWNKTYESCIDIVAHRVKKKALIYSQFSTWICNCENASGSLRERLLGWRVLEILMERDLRKSQQTLDFIEYNISELEQRLSSGIRATAELFLSHEFNLPYYYGFPRLASLASSNIEQFLLLSGDIFEECISAVLLRKSMQLTPVSQERIIRKSIKGIWQEIPQRVKFGTQVRQLLESIGMLAQWETEKPNAPYSPGVTGIAISMSDMERLKEELKKGSNPQMILLGEVLASCISQNLLEIRLDQKCKGQNWMVMYLNRMLCVYFELPLQYGGWREKRLIDLQDWLKIGFTRPNSNTGELFNE